MDNGIVILRKLEISKSFTKDKLKFEKGEIIEQVQTPVGGRYKRLHIIKDGTIIWIDNDCIVYESGSAKVIK